MAEYRWWEYYGRPAPEQLPNRFELLGPPTSEVLGVDPTSGLAGAVGTDPMGMLDVLANGTVRERAIALGNFQQLLAKQALAGPNVDGLDGIAHASRHVPFASRSLDRDDRTALRMRTLRR